MGRGESIGAVREWATIPHDGLVLFKTAAEGGLKKKNSRLRKSGSRGASFIILVGFREGGGEGERRGESCFDLVGRGAAEVIIN